MTSNDESENEVSSSTPFPILQQFVFQNKAKLNTNKRKSKPQEEGNSKQTKTNSKSPKSPNKRSPNRFNNMPEEQVAKLLLPDHIAPDLDILIIGINPGLLSAYKGHHYSSPGNHFWKCLHLSGFTASLVSANDDYKMLDVGIGLTNMVERTTRGSNDLSTSELKEGSKSLLEKLQFYKPKIAVFNGKQIYSVFAKKKQFRLGKQPDLVEGTNTYIWVMPSTSARCCLLPRAEDKVPYFLALKKFRDLLKNGLYSTNSDDSEFIFDDLKAKPKNK